MIIYEVELTIAAEFAENYLEWLPTHIVDMLQIDGFLSADVEEVLEPLTESTVIVVRYGVRSELDLFDYFELQAPLMRQEAIDRFGDHFLVSRRILKRKFTNSNSTSLQHPH